MNIMIHHCFALQRIQTCAVRSTWVPPQSSMEAPGTSTTRTAASLYFSPNMATAPAVPHTTCRHDCLKCYSSQRDSHLGSL